MEPADACTRWFNLCDSCGSYRLVAASETAKIQLSEAAAVTVDLGFIEPELTVPLTQTQLASAANKLLLHLRSLLHEVLTQGGAQPDLVYLTGGMARLPLTRACVQAMLPRVPLIDSDHFLSVTEGLTIWSRRLFGST